MVYTSTESYCAWVQCRFTASWYRYGVQRERSLVMLLVLVVVLESCCSWILMLSPVGCRKVKTLGVNAEGGVPDGMCLDHEGHIWTALCGGSAVVCIDPQSGDELHR